MRIIAGSAGGIHLKVPTGVTRPTTDRVREAVFSMLGDAVLDARILDLFAGSGGMGLEALSRGASSATFVEQQGQAAGVLEGNLTRAKLQGGRVMKADVFPTLKRLAQSAERYDLIFADPPYAKRPGDVDLGAKLLADPQLPQLMAPGALVVLECMVTKGDAGVIAPWEVVRDRAYGSTRILILQISPIHDGASPGAAALQSSPTPDVAGHGPQGMAEDEGTRREGV